MREKERKKIHAKTETKTKITTDNTKKYRKSSIY
jgi:hypothetical protein